MLIDGCSKGRRVVVGVVGVMAPRHLGAGVRLTCLLLFGPHATLASYACTSLGFECQHRIYTGSYTTEAAAEAACDSDSACVAYDFSSDQSMGFKCSTTTSRTDHYNEYKMCSKPSPPPSPPPPSVSYTHLTLPTN